MTTLLRIFLVCASCAFAFVKSEEPTSRTVQEILEPAESNNGLVGVSSIAGITSRNGRVSSLGGIQIYPGLDAPLTITNDGGGYFYPLTVTKEADGNFASGSIQLVSGYPGSVVVSSSARSGFGPDIKPLPFNINKPLLKEFIIQPLPELFEKARTLEPEPWFLKSLYPYNSRSDTADSGWFYPNFNPFMNFWR